MPSSHIETADPTEGIGRSAAAAEQAERSPSIERARRVRMGRLPRATSPLGQIAAGLVIMAVATALKGLLAAPTQSDIAYLLLFAALPIATLVGGRPGGVVLVLVGALVDTVIFHAPIGSLAIDDPGALARFLLFLPIGTGIVLLIADVDSHRRGAADSAARFEGLVDALPDPTLLVDADSMIVVYANPAVSALGHAPAALEGRPIGELVPELTDLADFDQTRRHPVTAVAVASSGQEVPTEVSSRSAVLPDGRPGHVVTVRDVRVRVETEIQLIRLARTERAQAEALATIISSLDEGAALFDDDGRLLVTNDAMTRMAGAPIASRSDIPQAWWAAGEQPILTGEPQRWLQVARHDLSVVGGHGQLILVADITRTMEADAARDAFVGVMSHELRTPVTTILTAAHLLHRSTHSDGTHGDPPGGRSSQALAADIRSEAERLNELIEDLLVLSRSQVGAVTFESEPVLVQHALRRAVEAEAERFPHVAFEIDVAPGLPPVDGDRTFVGQVLRNLIGNAAKYAPSDPTTVTVRATLEGEQVVVRVLDEGPGFEPELAERLFEIFFRAESTSRLRAGSGIGLYVSRTLVEAMGGRIWAANRPTGGAEFGFALGIAGYDDEDDEPADADATLRAEGGGRARRST
jgi:PAS domain S-box-containing protein